MKELKLNLLVLTLIFAIGYGILWTVNTLSKLSVPTLIILACCIFYITIREEMR